MTVEIVGKIVKFNVVSEIGAVEKGGEVFDFKIENGELFINGEKLDKPKMGIFILRGERRIPYSPKAVKFQDDLLIQYADQLVMPSLPPAMAHQMPEGHALAYRRGVLRRF